MGVVPVALFYDLTTFVAKLSKEVFWTVSDVFLDIFLIVFVLTLVLAFLDFLFIFLIFVLFLV